jgi:enterochelin esterase family protein
LRIELPPPDWATHFLSDLTDWRKGPVPVAEMAPVDIPDDAYFEYAYQDAQGQKREDPDNQNPRLNPWWPYACHLAGPRYRPAPMAQLPDRRPQGRVLRLEIESELLGQSRRVLTYSPPGQAQAELPVVLFQDGKAYYGWGKTPQVFDALLERGEVAPAHLVFLPPQDRTREYAFNPTYRKFIVEELLPHLADRVPCDGRRVAWGASLGGLLSAYLAWEHPDLFQRVVTQSGAYLFSEDMDLNNPFAGNESFCQKVRSEPNPDLAWHIQCGTLEWLTDSNQRVVEALRRKGAPVQWQMRNAGHNWVNWKNGLADGLRFALPR